MNVWDPFLNFFLDDFNVWDGRFIKENPGRREAVCHFTPEKKWGPKPLLVKQVVRNHDDDDHGVSC